MILYICIFYINYYPDLDVRAFIRNEAKVPENLKSKIESVVGDVTNAEQVAKAVADRDAVVVVLGSRNDLSMYTDIFVLYIYRALLTVII